MHRASICLTAAVAAAFMVAAPPAFSGGARREVAQYNYTTGFANPGGSSGEITLGYAEFETYAREKKASLSVVDASGRAVLTRVGQDVDGDDRLDWKRDFCSSTETPIRIQGGTPVQVFVLEGSCGSEASVPTTGSVEAVFRTR